MSAHATPGSAPLSPAEAARLLARRVAPVGSERIAWADAPGRVLAEKITLDRPSPACDVSAMDGYALTLKEPRGVRLAVSDEALPGRPPPPMPADGSVVRIFTGAPVPSGATAVVQRERVEESDRSILIPIDAEIFEGMHIRRKGENAGQGETVAEPGRTVSPGVMAAIASCGRSQLSVHRSLCVGVLVTGDEVLPVEASPEDWQLRDSNGPALLASLAPFEWVGEIELERAHDDPDRLAASAQHLIDRCDALLITGGVSTGDHDHVPRVLRELGLEILFHKLALRPGKPALGAITPDAKPVLGLPGNPVSVVTTARLLALPALRARAGLVHPPRPTLVRVSAEKPAPPKLWWYPLVRLDERGEATLAPSKGSGDWVAAASADGFVEVPPGEPASGLRPYFPFPNAL
ncbi:MAG: molybdopterin molybdotransferase MoeA [Phycisphaerales bacterium]|nr:molybdopterin molybdotransferase MoeA [Phycisphaerales bacterium]